jgi:steroid delta-isomerase-like uncharacterized protein
MSIEENKSLIRRFYQEVWDSGNFKFAYSVFAEDYVRHDLRPGQALPGPAGQAKIAEDFRRAFPNLRVTVDLVIGEDEFVVGRWTATGTHSGTWGGVQPTGRQVRFSAVNIYRFVDGKVAEIWNHRDDFGLSSQIGATMFGGVEP